MDVNSPEAALWSENMRLKSQNENLIAVLRDMQAFVAVMVGRGPDATIPETVRTPIGVPVKIGEIMRDASTALSSDNGTKP